MLGFALASAILAYAPLAWLMGSWLDPSYSSSGTLYLVPIAALLVWSLTSPLRQAPSRSRQRALLLLSASAFIRLTSQALAINVVGGFALALDVFALAALLRTDERARPVSPFWLAVLFVFTLPVERIVQRLIGYPLQEISARISCKLLGTFFDDMACEGVRLRLSGQDVLVDLPCSGTNGLMLAIALLTILNALYRPRLIIASIWVGIAFCLSIFGNSFRISLLAAGIAFEDRLNGISVMSEPLHDLIGYTTLALSMAPVLMFYKPSAAHRRPAEPAMIRLPASVTLRNLIALTFLAFAFLIVKLPHRAMDVSKAISPPPLPFSLNGEFGQDEDLLPIERSYFAQYGGHAQKRRYGELALTLVHTSSPLRHLHSPEDCLRGLGYRVEFLGTRFSPLPTALYRATSEAGKAWRVAVTFTSSDGNTTHNIAQAIWLWMQKPHTTWTSIQRITPWNIEAHQQTAFESAVIAALDLTKNRSEEG
ncbi:exosortase T [Stappia sediminis]|nr:exosortase T [Stappia sediminis]